MKTITYDDEAAPWSRSNHLIGTRLFPSSDDRCNNFSGTLCRTRSEIRIKEAINVLGLFNYAYLSPIASLSKLEVHSSTSKKAEVLTLPLPVVCPCHIKKFPFCVLYDYLCVYWFTGESSWT
jgi:hypothetical protein